MLGDWGRRFLDSSISIYVCMRVIAKLGAFWTLYCHRNSTDMIIAGSERASDEEQENRLQDVVTSHQCQSSRDPLLIRLLFEFLPTMA